MASHLADIHATMHSLLGETHHESYCLVHEVPAHAYGFRGLSQEQRFIAARLAEAQSGPTS